jgi:hypothetical protein
MESSSRDDIRRLLKAFGIEADEAMVKHLVRAPGEDPLLVRLVLEDLTDYGDSPPDEVLRLEMTGEIRR